LGAHQSGETFSQAAIPDAPWTALYTSFVKPNEFRHDATVYPVYQREAALIERDGEHVRLAR
jgi:hypothetical protein